jgi:sterol desaturase/sphingolipid hydroxylase (fatty acid hydroxylase superfamily)
VNSLIVRFGLLLVLAVLVAATRICVPHALTAFIAAQPLWLQIPEAMLVGDFCLYWAHRALHANAYLWRLHMIHHAIEELDWLGAYHMHPLDEIVLSGAAFGSVYIVGFSPAAVTVYLIVYAIISVAVHLNTRLRVGPLRWLIGSPEFHHWHHSNERQAKDRNFAAIFSLWDVAFGTVYLPGHAPSLYGVDERVPPGYVDQLCLPFRRRPKTGPETATTGPEGSGDPLSGVHVSQTPAIL